MRDQELVNALRYLCPGNFTCARCKYEPVCHGDGCAIIQKAADRIANQSTHIAALQQEIEKLRAQLRHLGELAEADKAGRLAVLPCKVGDTLWVTGRDNVPREMELEAPDIRAVCTDEDNLCMSTCNRKPDGFCAYRLRNDGADVGKTVFLTREEAEKALEAMKDE